MLITVVNRSKKIKDADLQAVIRAINRQIAEDFLPYWSFGATLRLEGATGAAPNKDAPGELRGDAILYLSDTVDVADALGYHDSNARGIPYGFVFTELAAKVGENWTVTLSHEALELVGDSLNNLLVQGPHPSIPGREVFHWFEMCDAVQDQSYKIDGIEVANFVLPLYFTPGEQEGGRNDFLGVKTRGKGLDSFGVAPGGYIGFYDPVLKAHDQYCVPGDKRALQRKKIKSVAQAGRGYQRSRSKALGGREDAHMSVLSGLFGAAPSATAADDPIKHVVVLMLENRSFDHMLGGITKVWPKAEGVKQNGKPNRNLDSKGRAFEQKPGALPIVQNRRDLDHEHDGTMAELGAAASPMSGFVSRFELRYPNATADELQQVMSYFDCGDTPDRDALPALHTLARNFAVCDHWFSSMPGPTWPNRFFVHSGTCLGHVLMPSSKEPQNMRLYYQDTIYDRLDDGGVRWKIFHDGVPQSIVMTSLLKRYLTRRGYEDMDTFFEMAKGKADDFPEFSFIEPSYFGAAENDQHPPADVRDGERLIAKVYDALRGNDALWKSTLLVILYDEHGGFYDHVAPPATVSPDDHVQEYTFDRLGVRVPAILVSPWVDAGVVDTVFDHTSLLRYLCDKWNLAPLGARMQASAGNRRANSFADALKRTAPRTDAPPPFNWKAPAPQRMAMAAAELSTEGSRDSLLWFVEQLPAVGPPPAVRGRRAGMALKTEAPAAGDRIDAALSKLQGLRAPETPGDDQSAKVKGKRVTRAKARKR